MFETKYWNDILYIWMNGFFDVVSIKRRNQISPRSHIDKILVIIRTLIANFIKLFKKNDIPINKVWFFSLSGNNFNALVDIKNITDNSIFVVPYYLRGKASYKSYPCNLRFKFLYDIIFPVIFIEYLVTNFRKFAINYDLFFKVNGQFSESVRVLRKYRPKAIVFANDHEIFPRALLKAANFLNITTIYIQHASISKYFPPLQFTHALLEGQDSKDKYLKISQTDSVIELIGMAKFDRYIGKVNNNDKVYSIGVAYNAMDDRAILINILNEISLNLPNVEIIVRPHPSDTRDLDLASLNITKSINETSFEFLSKIDVLIASDSSIHLEAVIMNVYSLGFNFSHREISDYYGFIEKNLIENKDSVESLLTRLNLLIKHKPFIQERAIYFNSAIGSDYYGKSVERAAEIINRSIRSIDEV